MISSHRARRVKAAQTPRPYAINPRTTRRGAPACNNTLPVGVSESVKVAAVYMPQASARKNDPAENAIADNVLNNARLETSVSKIAYAFISRSTYAVVIVAPRDVLACPAAGSSIGIAASTLRRRSRNRNDSSDYGIYEACVPAWIGDEHYLWVSNSSQQKPHVGPNRHRLDKMLADHPIAASTDWTCHTWPVRKLGKPGANLLLILRSKFPVSVRHMSRPHLEMMRKIACASV
jgi:hypothetical protein